MKRYKVTLSSNTVYKEIELASDLQQVKVGTGVDCDIRLRKELFFGQIELNFIKNKDTWTVICSDNLYITVGDVRKLATKQLNHGDVLEVKYQDSDNLVFAMEFLIDFDDGKKYERIIDVSGATSLTIGTSANCNITIGGEYAKDDALVLTRKSDGFVVDIQNTTYGVYINGKKAKNKDIIKDRDFLSVSEKTEYIRRVEQLCGLTLRKENGLLAHFANVDKALVPADAYTFSTVALYLSAALCDNKRPVFHTSEAFDVGFYSDELKDFDSRAVVKCSLADLRYPEVTGSSSVVGYFGISAACYTAESAVKLFPAESLPAEKRAPYVKPFASECVIHIIICRYLFCREKFLIWS